jgi:fucose permease
MLIINFTLKVLKAFVLFRWVCVSFLHSLQFLNYIWYQMIAGFIESKLSYKFGCFLDNRK